MPIKTLGSLGKIRVGRVTGNAHIFFFWPYTKWHTHLVQTVRVSVRSDQNLQCIQWIAKDPGLCDNVRADLTRQISRLV